MPGFIAPIKNTGSSQPEKESGELESNDTFSSIILGRAVKNAEKKTNPFESCLQALNNISASQEANNKVLDSSNAYLSNSLAVNSNELSSVTWNTESVPETNDTQHSTETQYETNDNQFKTNEKQVNYSYCENTTEDKTANDEIVKASTKLNEKTVNKSEDKKSNTKKSDTNKVKKSMKKGKENDGNVNNSEKNINKTKENTKQPKVNRKKDDKANNEKTKRQDGKKTNKIIPVPGNGKQNKPQILIQEKSQSEMIDGDVNNHSQEISCSQASNFSSVFSKMILSQAPKNYSHKQRMEWLQERRQVGLWVQCNKPDCLKWRYLPHIHDPTSLPEVWYCYMNPDGRANECSKKERKIKLREEEDCIHGQYSAGSLVWGHLQGFPWWPAIVDDDPDTEQFYWLDGFSDIPTYYHVTFLDSENVTRAWLTPNSIKPFVIQGHYNKIKNIKVNSAFTHRLKYAIDQAKEAIDLTILERLRKYSFIALYKGPINSPKGEKLLKKTQKRCIESSSESDSSDSDQTQSQVIISKKKTKRNKCRIAKMLETELSQTSMVSLEDLIIYNTDTGDVTNLQSEVDSSASSRASETSPEIPMQPKIRVHSTNMNILQEIIPETENCSSIIESTVNRVTQDNMDTLMESDAVVPSTNIDIKNLTENSTQSFPFSSY